MGTKGNTDWVLAFQHLPAPDGLYIYSEEYNVRYMLRMQHILIIVLGASLLLALWVGV